MLIAAVILTVFSIIGSVAFADLPPLTDFFTNSSNASQSGGNRMQSQQESTTPEKSRENSSFLDRTLMASVDYANEQHSKEKFNSVVKPRLTSCFNCGVIVAIETVNGDSAQSTTVADDALLFEYQLDNYLDAHSKNARLIVLDEDGKHLNTDDEDESNSMTYVIKVRMQNGSQHVVTQDTAPAQNVGDKVRLITERTITA
ncbi:MAG: hypothetical protein CVU35_00815 [Betaproteobacteria bacterium HGW-Betaproteobacteria-8]|nr:MAG: hypothetical protein CVU35_00815 [Betaproteobacteria bacterium HGW-Betaproteobacteria-8]